MRLFWAVIALLVVVSVVVVVRRGAGDVAPSRFAATTSSSEPIELPAPTVTGEPVDQRAMEQPSEQPGAPPAVAVDLVETPTDSVEAVAEIDEIEVVAPDSEPELQTLIDDLLTSSERAGPTEAAPDVAVGDSDDREHEPIAEAPPAEESFVIRGTGTADDPFQITWELLISAGDDYRPRLGMNEIPQRIQDLHEKHVRITGYLAAPMASGEVDEVLVMLNQWDGCCIGVPPSPYDSIEVRLDDSIRMGQAHMVPYGTVEGLLKIDPYLVSEWLVGLYLMEGAQIELGM